HWMDSFWHKDEQIPAASIDGLQNLLDEKVTDAPLENGPYVRNGGIWIPFDSSNILLSDAVAQSLSEIAPNLAIALAEMKTAIITIRDQVRRLAGAAVTLNMGVSPQTIGLTETLLDFSTSFASTNTDVIDTDDNNELIAIKINGRYQYATYVVFANPSTNQYANITLRTRSSDDAAGLITERVIEVPKNSVYIAPITNVPFDITDAPRSVYVTFQSDIANVQIVEFETTLTTSANTAILPGGGLTQLLYSNISEIKAITGYGDGNNAGDVTTGIFYEFSSASTATPDDIDVLLPDDITEPDPGRWVKKMQVVRKGDIEIITNEQPTVSLKFDKSYWPDETRQLDLSSGDLTLSLNTGVTNVVGNCNWFDVVADGVHAINIETGFKSNGVFPIDLDGMVPEAGTHPVFCIYSPNGIVINIPTLISSGVTPEPSTHPTATNVYFTGQPVVGQTMSGQYTFNAGSGGLPESGTTYQWYRATDQSGTGRVAISGATFRNYVVQAADEDYYLQFEVTVSDGTNTGDAVQSAWSRQVALTDTFPPEIQLKIIEDANPNILKLVFDEDVTATNLGYTVKYDTVVQTIISLSGSGTNELLLEISRQAQSGEVITFSYDSTTGDTVDGNSNELVSFTDVAVTNEVQSSPIAAIPYNTDLVAAYMYNQIEVDDVSGNITVLKNPINSALNLPCTSTDANRPTLDDANKRVLMYGKIIEDGSYTLSDDGTFTVVLRIEQQADDPNELNRSLLYNSAYRTLNLRTFTQGYFFNVLTTINKAFYDVHFGKHVITMVSDGANVSVYLDEKTTPMFTSATALTNLILTSILKTYTVSSKIQAFQEMLFYNRALSEAERLIVTRDYLGNKYGVDTGDRPVITSFGLTNVSNGGTVNNSDVGQFAFTLSDSRVIDRIILLQTTNSAYMATNTSYLILEDGTLREFNFDVPPFNAQSNVEFGIIVIDELGRVSDIFIDTTINFTITDV
ncbi:hypothetical protein, partial [Carboxylicivirga linearis]